MRKAVSLKLLRDNNIGFTSHSVGEEALYSFRVLHAAASMSFIDKKPVYFYVNHEGSQSKLRIADPLGEVVSCLRNYLLEQGLYRKYADTVNAFNLTSTLISLDRIEWMYTGERKRNEVADRMRFFELQSKALCPVFTKGDLPACIDSKQSKKTSINLELSERILQFANSPFTVKTCHPLCNVSIANIAGGDYEIRRKNKLSAK